MKLSLTMICKDELKNLKRIYPLIKDHIDEWIVVVPPKDKAIPFLKDKATIIEKDFTQTIEPEIREWMGVEYGLEVDKDYRLFNFAAARNASLEAATGDYVMWIDADDTPVGMTNLRIFVEMHPETDVFDAIYDYYRDEEGNPISDHVRERVIRNDGKMVWKGGKLGLIHETLLPKDEIEPVRLDIPDDLFRVEHQTDHVDSSSMRNHIALLYEYLKTKGEDPRTTYYLGIEFFNRKMWDYCIKVLLEYVKVSGSDEERYYAWVKIAEAYHMMGDRESGRNAYLSATTVLPSYPHAYLGLGESFWKDEQWAKAVEFTMTGLQKKLPGTKSVVDKTRFTFRPAVHIALSYMQLGKPLQAYEWFLKAMKLNPKHPWVKEHAPLFMEAKDLDDYVRGFVKIGQIAQRRYPKTLSKLAEVIPDELKDQEILMDFKWRYTTPKIWEDNTVVFFCSSAFEDWGPESLEKGCGGSEEAVIQLTKRLAKMGWQVTVYNNCPKEGTFDGVRWVRFERFNPRDMFNILVSWRNNIFLDAGTAVKKYVDMHDVPTGLKHYTPDLLEGVKVLVKSRYHRSLFKGIPREQFVVIPNGVDLAQFKKSKKTKNNLVWTSSYDRGLEHLLNMWPKIREAVPDATLDVYYGFELYDSTPWGRTLNGQAWKVKMQKLLQQEGVTDHGRVGTDEVAKAYLKADVWAYPSDFPEIDCITATKAMAGKAVPIATNQSAVAERNQGISVDGDINQPDVQRSFCKALIKLLKDEPMKKTIRETLDVDKYDWEQIAKRWDKEFKA